MRRRWRAERIEMRLEVTVGAVGVNQAAHLSLLDAIDDLDAGRCRGGEGSAIITQRKALEKCPPRGVDGVRIIEPEMVHLLDDFGICAGRKGDGIHGEKERS